MPVLQSERLTSFWLLDARNESDKKRRGVTAVEFGNDFFTCRSRTSFGELFADLLDAMSVPPAAEEWVAAFLL